MSHTIDQLIQRVSAAQKIYASFDQSQVDHIFKAAALAANDARIPLARMAVEETGMGVLEDKVIKNQFSSEFVFNKYKDDLTCGVIESDPAHGIQKIAEPIGVIAGIVPTTNPTSTAVFKALLSLKTRNGIVFSPHPRARRCTSEAARIVHDAAVAAGAPEGIIGWIENPTVEDSQRLMSHPATNLILATGGPGMVRAAYSSGKPAIGVGPGDTPVVIHESAHIKLAVNSILLSKTFDNGTVCASEQSVIVPESIASQVRSEFESRGAHFLTAAEKKKLDKVVIKEGHLNAEIVGQTAYAIAQMAGVKVDPMCKVLIGECQVVGEKEPFSYEKLSPLLGFYVTRDYAEALDIAEQIVRFGGFGHTSVLYVDPVEREVVEQFSRLKTGRILVNMPASQGAIGDIYNFKLEPSMTLGCGSWGGNSVSENIGIRHLMNIKTVADRKENMLWFRVPPKIYFKPGSLEPALRELKDRSRAFIVTDRPLLELGYTDRVTTVLREIGVEFEVFADVRPDPTLEDVNHGLERINSFKPDVIIALGGGSPMDAAKIMWLMYEHPEVEFSGLALRFMDIRKRIYDFPETGKKASFVAIPTTSGTGSEVTPFAVVSDNKSDIKYPIADYSLTPDMAIVDPDLVMEMPARLTAYSGLDCLSHAIEAYVSAYANETTNGLALESIRLVFKYLPDAYAGGAKAIKARQKMHYAATTAGMAFANAFLGINHSLAHSIGSAFHLPHGLAIALHMRQVINYNRTDAPRKQSTFPQYTYPLAHSRYVKIANHLGIKGRTDDQKIDNLVEQIGELMQQVDIPLSTKEAGVEAKAFAEKLDAMAERAFDDQCTPSNPRYPFISELKALYQKAYEGEV